MDSEVEKLVKEIARVQLWKRRYRLQIILGMFCLFLAYSAREAGLFKFAAVLLAIMLIIRFVVMPWHEDKLLGALKKHEDKPTS